MAAVAKTLEQVQDEAFGENGVHDMINMNKLTEETILKNVQIRFGRNIIYTYIGSILVAMNPYQVLPIYTQKAVDAYVGKPIGSLPPHIFATADACFRAMTDMRKNQAVIISGDSGAGKTETTKLILQYLASMTQKHSEVEQMILETSPILESFGNAKTVRNNNSSRFGKFIEIHFDASHAICGAKISQYLLEKSRIVGQAQNERNFHIFYQFVAGVSDEERAKYVLPRANDFNYLNQSGCIEIPGVDDAENFERTRMALSLLGISDEVQDDIWSILATVLHLGNLKFVAQGEGSKVSNNDELQICGRQLQVDPQQLGFLLTTRNLNVRGQITQVPLPPKQAAETRDALAKILYKRLFEWLVARINVAIHKPQSKKLFIGVLDIFGFENFKINSFEQFCIDYANEKLQQHFNHALFKLEQDEYDKEQINWSKIAFKDNQETIDLIEKTNPPGLISLLDEESKFPKATDLTFLDKISQRFKEHNSFAKPRTAKTSFVVKHYAGDVEYQVENFLDKNKDTIYDDILGMLATSRNTIVCQAFKQDLEEAKAPGASKRTIASQFRTNLGELMATLSACHAFYVRCIKPNGVQQPVTFDVELVMAQLRYTGMLDTIRIRRLGFPVRWPHYDFFRRYECLVMGMKWNAADARTGCANLASKIAFLGKDTWQVGKTKVFLRDKEHALLEAERNKRIAKTVIIIQAWWKMILTRNRFRAMKEASVVIQAHFRRYRWRRRFLAMRAAAVSLQATARMLVVNKTQRARLLEKRRRDAEERRRKEEEERKRIEWERTHQKEVEARKRKEAEEAEKKRKDEEKRAKELEKERAKEAEKQKKKEEKEAKKSGRESAVIGAGAADDEGDDEVDPSWDALMSPRSGGSGVSSSPPAGTPAGSSSPSILARSGTMSRGPSATIVVDSSGVKTLKRSDGGAGGSGDGYGTMRMGTMTLRRKHGKPLTTLPPAPPILQKGEENKYTFQEFASRNFQSGAAKSGLMTLSRNNDKDKRKTVSVNEAIGFVAKPIKESLLPLKYELQKLALQIFAKLLLYMQSGAPRKPGKTAKWQPVKFILDQAIAVPEIRDEIYCQVIKQTINNSSKETLLRAWQVLLYCSATFLPSQQFLPVLASYLTTGRNQAADIGQIASFALKRLERGVAQKMNRVRSPSYRELEYLRDLKLYELPLHLPGGAIYKFEIDSATQSGEVIALLAAKLGLPDPVGYALYEIYDPAARLEQSLGMYDYISDSYGKPEVKKIMFKRKLYLHKNEVPESYPEQKLLCHQCAEEIVDGSLPLTLDDVLVLAAWMLQVKLAKKKTTSDPVKFDLKRHLPSAKLRSHTPDEWKRMIFEKHAALNMDKRTKIECKRLYLEAVAKMDPYGSTLFAVEVDPKANPLGMPLKLYVAVNAEGVHLQQADSRTTVRSFFFTEVDVVATQYRSKLFYNDGKKQYVMEVSTTRGPELASLVKEYVFWLRLESQYGQAIKDYQPGDDPNLLNFKKGDLIFITDKDEEGGWYVGECNGAIGSFPADAVEVLITVPDTLAKMMQASAVTQIDPKAARSSFRNSGLLAAGSRSSSSGQRSSNMGEHEHRASLSPTGALSAVPARLLAEGGAGKRSSYRAPGAAAPAGARKSARLGVVDPNKFTFEAYARENFSELAPSSVKSTVDKAISFTQSPIKGSLLKLPDEKAQKVAQACFVNVMKFMEDFPDRSKKPTETVRDLCTVAVENPSVADEIYCQILKQMRDNPKPQHVQKGWELLSICARVFTPSTRLMPFLQAYLQSGQKGPYAQQADAALDRLLVTQVSGSRSHAPTLREIESILTGSTDSVDVYLSDGQKKSITVDSATTVGEVVAELLRQTKLPYRDAWGLCEVISAPDYDKDRALKPTDNVNDVRASWKGIKPPKGVEKLDFKLVYKKVLFLPSTDDEFDDPRFSALLYHQCVYNIISCKQPVQEDGALFFASHYLQVLKGNYVPGESDRYIQQSLRDLLPTPFLLTRPESYWLPKVTDAWRALSGQDRNKLMRAYVARARMWPLFGCARFAVQHNLTKKSVVDATIAINKDGVHLLEIYSQTPLRSWPFSQISSWTPTRTAFTIVTGNLINPKREVFRTIEADDIAFMYKAYTDIIATSNITQTRNNMLVVDAADYAGSRMSVMPSNVF